MDKIRTATKTGKKRFSCAVWDEGTKQWSHGRPEGMPLLFNLSAIARILKEYPTTPLLIVEGEKDVYTASGFGLLATTNADGAGKWRVEDTRKLIELGARKIIICPDNDGPGMAHGIQVAKMFRSAGVEVRWLELPGLGPKEDLSDWAPNQVHPDALLDELIETAPLFDAESLGWRSRLKLAGPKAGYTYRGDIPNLMLALASEPRLKDRFTWNDFRHRVEVSGRTPVVPTGMVGGAEPEAAWPPAAARRRPVRARRLSDEQLRLRRRLNVDGAGRPQRSRRGARLRRAELDGSSAT